MAIKIDYALAPGKLQGRIQRFFELSASKILSLEKSWDPARGTPVFTVQGRYTSRGWTEWTQGFQFGSALLQYDATDDEQFLRIGREGTRRYMASHVSHIGVHDHGFNNISTYGALLRFMREKRLSFDLSEKEHYELALKVSGAVQAARWTKTAEGKGFIYSFNGPHSLFIDTMRSLRALAVAHQLGHVLMGEHDQRISLLQRLVEHAHTTATFAIYYGEGRDAYDVRGRVAHESIFNTNDGLYRCPNSQQGYSPFSTWTRGLAWAICGFAEQLEFLRVLPDQELKPWGGRDALAIQWLKAARATADFYLANTPACGVPYWDTGAPNLSRIPGCLNRRADPFNPWEPVDSSAAAIAAQGLIRLGNYLLAKGTRAAGRNYRQAGLTIARTLFNEPYLSLEERHQGVLLHSVYHRPNGWDYVAPGQKVPNGESSMWGDYHARELALMIWREARGKRSLVFFED
ncbi:MAG TPA: glycoside hydrolase family 88 protein [Candidatus Paceibacterota bacterium]|nr:glycoside hydrolase family 88 protein [Verrucomicrobiota bacterium]HRY46590.1 glycoside hydrolase family 88 protein [Candidatus Paceibacterota bacterium]